MTPAKMTVAPSLVALSVAGTANSAATPEENCMTYTEFVAAYCSDSWSEEAAKALQRRRPRLQAIDGGKSDSGAGFRARLVTPSFITTVRPAKSN